LVERRQASAPEAEGRRKPPSPWRALCAACVQVVDHASAGVPFPFFCLPEANRKASFVARMSEAKSGNNIKARRSYPDIAPLIRATGYGPYDIAV
jgi:hypothetical protein